MSLNHPKLKGLILCFILSIFSENLLAQTYDTERYDALEYRLVGPFRGSRSAAVTGVPGKPNLFYFSAWLFILLLEVLLKGD